MNRKITIQRVKVAYDYNLPRLVWHLLVRTEDVNGFRKDYSFYSEEKPLLLSPSQGK